MLKPFVSLALAAIILTSCAAGNTETATPAMAEPQQQENALQETTSPAAQPQTGAEDVSEMDKAGDPEELYRKGEALQSSDPVAALAWHCYAARQGHGGAQYQAGRMLMTGGPALEGLIPADKKEFYRGRMRAAAMMWLDMAIINNVPEGKQDRKNIGKTAAPADFELYSRYTRMEIEAPCTMAEIIAVEN